MKIRCIWALSTAANRQPKPRAFTPAGPTTTTFPLWQRSSGGNAAASAALPCGGPVRRGGGAAGPWPRCGPAAGQSPAAGGWAKPTRRPGAAGPGRPLSPPGGRRRPPKKGRKKPGPTLNGAGRRYRLGERGVQGLAFPGAKPGPMAYGPGRLYPSAAGYRPRATPAAVARISPPAQGLVMPGSSSGGRSGAGRFPGYAPARPGSGAGRNPGRRAASRCLRR